VGELDNESVPVVLVEGPLLEIVGDEGRFEGDGSLFVVFL
jgi:hypothetical protein